MRSAWVALLLCLLIPAAAPAARDRTPPVLSGLDVTSGARWDDDALVQATITPNGDGVGDRAVVTLRSSEPVSLYLDLYRLTPHAQERVRTLSTYCRARCRLTWDGGGQPPGTFVGLIRAVDRAGNVTRAGRLLYRKGRGATAPVLRIRRVEAYSVRTSYSPGESVELRLAADRPRVRLSVLRLGPERTPTTNDETVSGIPMLGPIPVDWSARRREWSTLRVPIAPTWPTGLYVVRVTTDDGQTGFAPFIVRPAAPGTKRIAVVLPTHTWQAYNRADFDSDGLPDTWYVNPRRNTVPLLRPYMPYGLPGNLRRYELPLLHWIETKHPGSVEYLGDDDLDALDGATLAARYDLLVLGGHAEYVTTRMYDAVEGFRDRGGNIFATFSNTFFWRVDGSGGPRTITRSALWRQVGRPESALLGVQYLANDDGTRTVPYVVRQGPADPGWFAFEGTGLGPGSSFGRFGVEIDHTTRHSPPGTLVLAEAPGIFGPRYTAQMTAYTTPAGARVVAAGAFLFARSAWTDQLTPGSAEPVLANLWNWLVQP